jgi:hypothetical protein
MTATATEPQAAKRYAIGRYDNRVLVSQRTGNAVQITDVSLAGGRSYHVETLPLRPDTDPVPEIQGIAAAYLEHAEELGRCPLAASWWKDAPAAA